jgi:hypothetical protein
MDSSTTAHISSSPELYHVSETGGIECFVPRPDGQGQPRVWAINGPRLHNYLLPRDCPRVTYYATRHTHEEDRHRFFSGDATVSVVAIEHGWLDRIRSARLYLYRLPPGTFDCTDAIAGYHVSRLAVRPLACEAVDDVLTALQARPVELRVLANLWPLRDAVAGSSLAFSIIRMRNALPPPGSGVGALAPAGEHR